MQLDNDLIYRPPGYAEQFRQLAAAMPWTARRDDPRRISYLELGMVVLFLVLFWFLT